MSVEYLPVTGFGVLLTKEEVAAALSKRKEDSWQGYPPAELSRHYHLPTPKSLGNSHEDGGVKYLYYVEQVRDVETGSVMACAEHIKSLKHMIEECALDKKPDFHEGVLVC